MLQKTCLKKQHQQFEVDFENEGGETFICGNPPFSGYNKQTPEQKADMAIVLEGKIQRWGKLDYVSCWLYLAASYCQKNRSKSAFVTTNSIFQGTQVPILWDSLFQSGAKIFFAHTSFKWRNLAAHNAGITVAIVGFTYEKVSKRLLMSGGKNDTVTVQAPKNINGYLIDAPSVSIDQRSSPLSDLPKMSFGNHPYFASQLIMNRDEAKAMVREDPSCEEFLRPIYGSKELVTSNPRICIWVTETDAEKAMDCKLLTERFAEVKSIRSSKIKDKTALKLAEKPFRFRDQFEATTSFIAVPQVTSENREFLPVSILGGASLVTFKCFAIYDSPLWALSLVASRLHWVWVGAVCARMRTDFSYSNTLGWNTFPVPTLTEKNKEDLTRCAENILLAREAHFPKTIADLYDPEKMPENLRQAHEENDEVLERIYIGRRFRNDTERLEKLFDMYYKNDCEHCSLGFK